MGNLEATESCLFYQEGDKRQKDRIQYCCLIVEQKPEALARGEVL